jgi:hypothetical protein
VKVLLTLVSAKGSPGVTTTAAALAAAGAEQRAATARSQGVDLVELDPAGGDIEPLTGPAGESGLLRAASDLRPAVMVECTVDVPRGVRSLLAPTGSREACGTVMAGLDAWGPALSSLGGVVIADAGQWDRAHPAAGRLHGSDLVGVVCRPDARSVEHVRHVLDDLRSLVWPAPVVVLTVGDRPYPVAEVAKVLGVVAGGMLAWDPRGAAALWADGIGPRRVWGWPSSLLARSARAVLGRLVEAVEQVAPR